MAGNKSEDFESLPQNKIMKIIWNEHSVKLHRNIQKIVKSLVCVNFNNFYELRTGEKSSELNLCCFFADPFVCVL